MMWQKHEWFMGEYARIELAVGAGAPALGQSMAWPWVA
jgi:hypothetical protein